jgi:hypothetical protein
MLSRYNWETEKLSQIKFHSHSDLENIKILVDDFDADHVYFTSENKLYKMSFKDDGMTFALEKLRPIFELKVGKEILHAQFLEKNQLIWLGSEDFFKLMDLSTGKTIWEVNDKFSSRMLPSVLVYDSFYVM